jgi:hypothetical protein
MALTQVQGAMVGPTGFANLSGITFPATQVPSADANTLDDYEEGTWTVTDQSGAGLTFGSNKGTYTKIGSMVYFAFDITFPVTANGTGIKFSLPFTIGSVPSGGASGSLGGGFVTYSEYTSAITGGYTLAATATMILYGISGATITNANQSGKEFALAGFYRASA